MTDWYTKIVLTLIAVALLLSSAQSLLWPAYAGAGAISADDLNKLEAKTTEIPKSWGRFVGVSEKRLYFEAADGTIRQYPATCVTCTWTRK